MPQANQANIDAATAGFHVLYQEGLTLASPMWTPFCEVVPSDGALEEHFIPDGGAELAKFVGEQVFKNFKVWQATLRNETYQAAQQVKLEDFEDDKLGLYNGAFRRMGAKAATHPDRLMAQLLNNGFDDVGIDNVAFFATTHPKKGGTQSNKAVAVLDADAYDAAMAAIAGYQDWEGTPVNPASMGGKYYLVVPPALRATAMEILSVERLEGGATNKNYKSAELVVNPYLTSSTAWFLLVGNGAFKPFIKQDRTKLAFRSLYSAEEVQRLNYVAYGARVRYALGYGPWQAAYGSTGAGS